MERSGAVGGGGVERRGGPRREARVRPGKTYSPTGHNLFSAYGSKLLQMDPLGTLPRLPPATRFRPDYAVLAASTGEGVPPGFVRLASDRPTSAGAVVEILALKLRNERASAKGRYVTQNFVRFESPGLTVDLPFAAGWWALGFREVCAATGEQRAMVPCEVVEVR